MAHPAVCGHTRVEGLLFWCATGGDWGNALSMFYKLLVFIKRNVKALLGYNSGVAGKPGSVRKGYRGAVYRSCSRCYHWLCGLGHTTLEEKVRVQSSEEAIRSIVNAGKRLDTCLPLGINVSGFAFGRFGLSHALRSTVRAIDAAGIDYCVNNMDMLARPPADVNFGVLASTNRYLINLLHFNPDSLLHLYSQRGREYFDGRYNIGYWFWETPRLPNDWIEVLPCLHEVWTSSEFVRNIVKLHTGIPVVNVGSIIDVDESKANLGRSFFGLPHSAFVFLFYFDYQGLIQRKNVLGLIEAFERAFPTENDVRLVIKTLNSDDPEMAESRRAVEAASGDSRIAILNDSYSRNEMLSLVKSSDCVVSLHRAEGFGYGLAEPMAMGKPVIATAYSGNMDFMHPGNSLLVRYQLETLSEPCRQFPAGTIWADPDLDHASELMREVYKDPAVARALGEQAERDIKRIYSREQIGLRIRQRIKAICAGEGLNAG